MTLFDWFILVSSLVFIVAYGVWKGRGSKNMDAYLLSNRDMKWYTIGISIMATQASAITFLSTPGQAYVDGMRFVQFYFGLPIAMVILSVTVIPIYHKLKVFTAYEFLESRFDLKTRTLGAILFLTQRGLAAGLTIYAPALILSVILGWNVSYTNWIIGTLVIIYTTFGGTKAVGWTQFQQMLIITLGMVSAFFILIFMLPENVSFIDAAHVAGKMGKLNAVDLSFDLENRYTLWTGLIGGMFLALSYFGTDQSQVQRYLTGKSVAQSRMGLILNGLVKIPMQFFILFLGAMVFVFYQFNLPPVFFNSVERNNILKSEYAQEFILVEEKHKQVFEEKKNVIEEMLTAVKSGDENLISVSKEKLEAVNTDFNEVRNEAIEVMKKNNPQIDKSDTNYIFLSFVINNLPVGIIGLILAVVFAASMSSTSSELNALASTSIVDIYKRMINKKGEEKHYLLISKILTAGWGVYAIIFAEYANRLGSLIEAVNILGSLFYGTILGIFGVAFYIKKVNGNQVFTAAIIAEICVLACFFFTKIPFLWYNVIGCLLVMGISLIINYFSVKKQIA